MEKKLPEMQVEILREMMFGKEMKYSEIHKFTDNHDLFNYHLKKLIQGKYVEKGEKQYSLTQKGKQFVSHIEEDGTAQKQFNVGMFIDLLRKHEGKYQMLLHKRLKHPHYEYIGAVTGKLKWGESLKDNAIREIKEELGVEANEIKVIGVVREIFKDKDMNIAGDGVFFVIVVEEWKGEVAEKSDEGEYFWCDIDKVLNLEKIFRKGFEVGLPHLYRYLEDRNSYLPYVVENGAEGLEY